MSRDNHPTQNPTPIAVVGMSFRGPGDATDTENLLRMVAEGRESRSEIPEQKWNADAFYHPDANRYGTHNVKYGHWFQQDVYEFDAPFFSLSAAEAAALDPQQRMLLECSYEAFENSGTPMSRVVGTDTAVFTATFATDYTEMLWRDPESVPMYQCTNAGFSRANMANRISYSFDLKGPSVMVDTACSGGMTALHLACQSLLTGEARQALASGSSLVLGPEVMVTMSMMRFLSPDGRCYTFDERANGYARGEGVAVLLLKRLDDALADGDTIRAIIRGTGSNQDGKSMGITMPNSSSQEELIRSVYARTGLDPSETSYVECHGTGTQAGDTTETGAISRVFGVGRKQPLAIGSVKTNVGHLEGASGLASVIKSVLMLENGIILPNRNFEKANPKIPLKGWHLHVPTSVEPWNISKARRASVNSFGYGGANVHAILESAEDFLRGRGVNPKYHTRKPTVTIKAIQDALSVGMVNGNGHINSHSHINGNGHTNGNGYTNGQTNGNGYTNGNGFSPVDNISLAPMPKLFALSAFDPTAGESWARSLSSYIAARTPINRDTPSAPSDEEVAFLSSLAFTLSDRRTQHPWRATVAASSATELVARLAKVRFATVAKRRNIGYVFTGQGAQWCGMGRELMVASSRFRASLEACGSALRQFGAGFDVIEELEKDFETTRVNKAVYCQPLCTALQIALVDLLDSWGVTPHSVTGHSSGEIAAAYAAGSLSLEDAMLVAYERGRATSILAEEGMKGSMAAVTMEREELVALLQELKTGKAVIACTNSPTTFTVSGDKAAVDELQHLLRAKGVYNRRLIVDVAYHSHHMAPIADRYRSAISKINVLGGNEVVFFSSVTGKMINKNRLGVEYWVSNLVGEVKFAQSLIQLASPTGVDNMSQIQTLVEIGPHSALAGPIRQTIEASEVLAKCSINYLSVLSRKKDATATALEIASSLFVLGHSIRLSAVNHNLGSKIPPLIDLPSYAWNHTKAYTAESRISKSYRQRLHPRMDIIGAYDVHSSTLEPRWRQIIRLTELPWVRGHSIQSNIVYPAAGYIAMAIEAAKQHFCQEAPQAKILGYQLRDIAIGTALIISETPGEVEVCISLKTSPSSVWDEFTVMAVSSEGRWTEHCRGLIAVKTPPKASNLVNGKTQDDLNIIAQETLVKGFEEVCETTWGSDEVYRRFLESGMQYTSTFANINQVRSAPDQCITRTEIPDTAATMPMGYEQPFVIHPCTLDGIIQTYFPALAMRIGEVRNPYVPVSIEEMHVAHDVTRQPGKMLSSYTSTRRKDYRFITASITVFEDTHVPGSEPAVQMDGVTFAALDSHDTDDDGDQLPARAFNVKWAPDVDGLTEHELVNICSASGTTDIGAVPAEMNQIAVHLLLEALDKVTEQQSREAGQYAHSLWKLVQSQTERATTSQQLSEGNGQQVPKEIKTALSRAAEKLQGMLVGEAASMDLYEAHEAESVWRILQLLTENQALATYLHLLGHKKANLSVLTMGPRSGLASLSLLSGLSGLTDGAVPFGTFHCSDADFNVDQMSKARFPTWAGSMGFRDVATDGETYDVVFAFNATLSGSQFTKTLSGMSRLLRPGGKLVLVKHACSSPLATLLWSSLPGFAATPIHGQAAMSSSAVSDMLLKLGYQTQARLAEASVVVQSAGPKNGSHGMPNVLIVADKGQTGIDVQRLQTRCEELGAPTEVMRLEETQARPGQVCIVLSELTRSVLAEPEAGEWEALRRLAHSGAGVLWVTRGAGSDGCTNPQAALIQGFARTMRAETDDRPIVTLDLDGDVGATVSGQDAAACIGRVVERVWGFGMADDVELVERGGILLVPRLAEDSEASDHLQDGKASSGSASGNTGGPQPLMTMALEQAGSCRLFAGTPGLLDSLHFAPDERLDGRLGAGQVDVDVRACGINFKDVMMAMGQIPVEDLGCECSGVVRAVGSAVRGLHVGDAVVCMATGSFCTRLRVDARLARVFPQTMDFATAAALPITYTTAYHALHNMARVRAGDTVLVHAAAGGLGQALVELGRLAGADVLVTVGSPEKKQLVMSRFGLDEGRILYSRDTTFARDVMRITNGRGADVVINSLAGEALRQSWACIAPFGRFIELGLRDITLNTKIAMAPFARSASFAAFNLAYMLHQDPQQAGDVLQEVLALHGQGRLRGPAPLETYSFSQLEQAFRSMQTGRHMGKLVAVVEQTAVVKYHNPHGHHARKHRGPLFRHDASYLLVGGLGGIGRETALWMASCGARHLVMLSRSGPDSAAAHHTTAELQAAGCTTTVLRCDVSDAVSLATALASLEATHPPVRGVIQGAMVLRDSMLANMTLDDYTAVLKPKVQGTWNLHHQLPADMDFFLMESSISGIVGNATQAAYAAANTFLDAFARYRRSRGQAATTVDIGAVEGIGYLAQHDDLKHAMERQGFDFTDRNRLMRLFEFAIRNSTREPGAAHIVTGLGPWHPDTSLPALSAPLFARYRALSARGTTAVEASDTLRSALKQSNTLNAALALILGALVDQIVLRTGAPIENVSTSKSLHDYGIDSLQAVELRNWLSKEMDSLVPILELLAAESLDSLAVKIAQRSRLVVATNGNA